MEKTEFYSFYRNIPKAEIHIHIEAVISKESFFRLNKEAFINGNFSIPGKKRDITVCPKQSSTEFLSFCSHLMVSSKFTISSSGITVKAIFTRAL